MDATANNRFGSSTEFGITIILEGKDAKNTKNATKVALLCMQQYALASDTRTSTVTAVRT